MISPFEEKETVEAHPIRPYSLLKIRFDTLFKNEKGKTHIFKRGVDFPLQHHVSPPFIVSIDLATLSIHLISRI